MLVSAKKWRRSNHFTFLPHLNAGPIESRTLREDGKQQ
jgi:hypothetical protein